MPVGRSGVTTCLLIVAAIAKKPLKKLAYEPGDPQGSGWEVLSCFPRPLRVVSSGKGRVSRGLALGTNW